MPGHSLPSTDETVQATPQSVITTTLEDKYQVREGRIYLTGVQALVRLLLEQARRDKDAGLNTGGFVSGYRGSPLGGLDQALWQEEPRLAKYNIHFQPAVNEELAATAVMGSQQANAYPDPLYDGVFALWYGKGPGLDRASDALKHANSMGTSAKGGALVVVGDDHGAVSSSMAHQGEQLMASWMMPVLHPSSTREMLEYGLLGIAMSRFSGCYVGLKAVSEIIETAAVIDVAPNSPAITVPDDFEAPADGLHIRWPDPQLMQENRLQHHKLRAAKAFARANNIDQVLIDCEDAKIGIVTVGKAHLDVTQALANIGVDETMAAAIGLRLYKVGMSWPLEPTGISAFAKGLDRVLVIEEKRGFVETQLKEILYNLPDGQRPAVYGKTDQDGTALVPSTAELNPGTVAHAIVQFFAHPQVHETATSHLAFLEAKRVEAAQPLVAMRPPFFCSGCPHNTSTRLPEGSKALAGTGCHLMAGFMDRNTTSFIQMGGEGVNWIGQAPFTKREHIFQNLGDGTYVHSGSLAIRQAVASKANITYKILYNDAVAMTGGQPFEGSVSVPAMSQQLHYEGVRRIALVSDKPEKYVTGVVAGGRLATGTTIHHRRELNKVQRELEGYKGVSVLIYEQTCAAELRRRRKKGTAPDPTRRVFINEGVCDGCGDCSVQSNCISVVPIETPFGRKRTIDQSSCNKDFACAEGFCPAFVSVEGAQIRSRASVGDKSNSTSPPANIPRPAKIEIDEPIGIVVAGIGGTGVVTIGQLIGVAALIEGKGASVLDFTGLAQKGGGVLTHVRIAKSPDQIHTARLPVGGADLMIAGDMVVATGPEALSKMRKGNNRAIINSRIMPTANTVMNPDSSVDGAGLRERLISTLGAENTDLLDATGITEALMGDSIMANIFLLGYAFQKGGIPLELESLMHAIELNRVAVERNKTCFNWGRVAAHAPDTIKELTGLLDVKKTEPDTLDQMIERRRTDLVAYQNDAYAARYMALVNKVRTAEEGLKVDPALTQVVARVFYRLMAYKDEYEVARLFSGDAFKSRLNKQFNDGYALHYHMAPPFFGRRDKTTGLLVKGVYGSWVGSFMGVLAKFKGLRATPLDIFGYNAERRAERQLVDTFEACMDQLLATLDGSNHELAVQITSEYLTIRGFGHVKENNIKKAEASTAQLLEQYKTGDPSVLAAE